MKALQQAFAVNEDSVAIRLTVPAGSPDLAPEVLRARRSGATALLVWAEPTTIAGVITAARGSGWNVPIYTPAAGEDPLVRQQLANQPGVGRRPHIRGRAADRRGRVRHRFSRSSATTRSASECSSWA